MTPALRDRKAAQTRRALALAFADALTTSTLEEIRVDDIATAANVSRMTFFNYFPTKEAAVGWLYAAWLYQLQVDLHRRGLTGRAALLQIARAFARDLAGSRSGLASLFAAREVVELHPVALQLTEADRWLLAAELEPEPKARPSSNAERPLHVESFGRIITRACHEARVQGEVHFEGDPYEFGLFLGAAMSGTLLVGRSEHRAQAPSLLMRHVHRILGLPLELAAPAPVVPPAYTPAALTESPT